MSDPREEQDAKKPPMPTQHQMVPGLESKMDPKPDYGYDDYVGYGRLKDKVALITGADSGIGKAVALAFAREGADVACSYLNEHEDAKETQRVVEEAGRKCILLPGDLGKLSTIEQVVEDAVKAFGRIDILVNNASRQSEAKGDITEISYSRMEKTFNVNIIAMIALAQKCLPHMKPGSSIVNCASIQAYHPSPAIIDYACTKGAIVTMTKALGKDLVQKHGIRVNAVAPGPVWTPIPIVSFPDEKIEQFGKAYPMGRPAQPKEVAPAFVFLANNKEAGYVSGQVLGVTGGAELA